MLVTVQQLAAEFARSDRYVQQLVNAGMPKAAHGQYDIEICKTWYIRYLQNRIQRREGDASEDGTDNTAAYDRERTRLMKEQADKVARENAQGRGELVPLADYRASMSMILTAVRQHLLQMPGRIAPQLVGEVQPVIKAKLHGMVCAALATLSKGIEGTSEQPTDNA